MLGFEGGGIDILARLTSPVVGSMSTYWPLRLEEGVLARSLTEDWDRADSAEVVRERGSKVEAIAIRFERDGETIKPYCLVRIAFARQVSAQYERNI